MFVGEPKRLSHLIPDPFLLLVTDSKYIVFGDSMFFVIARVNASVRLGSADLCDCWHQGVIQAGQPGLVPGAGAVNVGFGNHLSLCLWGSMRH